MSLTDNDSVNFKRMQNLRREQFEQTALLFHPPSPPTPPTKPKIRAFSSPNEMVTFKVGTGEQQTTFMIHKQVACQHSEVWDRAFNGAFIEGQTQTYQLEDTDAEVFQSLMQWLYQEKFDHVHSGQDGLVKCTGDERLECAEEDHRLVKLWILAEKFLIRRLQNYTMEVMSKRGCGSMNPACYRYLYANTARDSILRRFAVEQLCWVGPKLTSSAMEKGYYPAQLLNDLVVALQNQLPENVKKRKGEDLKENMARFHVEENSSSAS